MSGSASGGSSNQSAASSVASKAKAAAAAAETKLKGSAKGSAKQGKGSGKGKEAKGDSSSSSTGEGTKVKAAIAFQFNGIGKAIPDDLKDVAGALKLESFGTLTKNAISLRMESVAKLGEDVQIQMSASESEEHDWYRPEGRFNHWAESDFGYQPRQKEPCMARFGCGCLVNDDDLPDVATNQMLVQRKICGTSCPRLCGEKRTPLHTELPDYDPKRDEYYPPSERPISLFEYELMEVLARRQKNNPGDAEDEAQLEDLRRTTGEWNNPASLISLNAAQIPWPTYNGATLNNVQSLQDTFGVAFSGGGVRSAAFCLGALRAMKGYKFLTPGGSHVSILDAVDYLSTVSGGGYTGTSYLTHVTSAAAMTEDQRREKLEASGLDYSPSAVSSPRQYAVETMAAQLADNAPYLCTTKKGCGVFMQRTLHLLMTLFLMACGNMLLIVATSVPLAALMDVMFGDGLRAIVSCLRSDTPSIGDCGRLLFNDYLHTNLINLGIVTCVTFGVLMILTIIDVIMVKCGYPVDVTDKPRVNFPNPNYRLASHAIHAAIQGLNNLAFMGFMVTVACWALLVAIVANIIWQIDDRAPITFLVLFACGIGATIVLMFTSSTSASDGQMRLTYVLLLFVPIGILWVYGRVAEALITGEYASGYYDGVWRGSLFIASVATLAVMVFSYSISTRALHMYYRTRLANAFYASGEDRKFLDLNAADCPLYICNVTINDYKRTGLDKDSFDFFTITPRFFGSARTGYAHTRDDISLSRAMAMSGGAMSVVLGRFDSVFAPFRFVLALLHFSMNDWVEFPVRRPYKHLIARLMELTAVGLLLLFFQDPKLVIVGPIVFGFILLASFLPIFNSFLYSPLIRTIHQCLKVKYTDGIPPMIYLSDGGHIENLAVYELLKRRCKTIFAFDGGADPSIGCEDLYFVLQMGQTYLQHYSNTRCSFVAEDESGKLVDFVYSVDFYRYLKTHHSLRIKITYLDLVTNTTSQGYLFYVKLLPVHAHSTTEAEEQQEELLHHHHASEYASEYASDSDAEGVFPRDGAVEDAVDSEEEETEQESSLYSSELSEPVQRGRVKKITRSARQLRPTDESIASLPHGTCYDKFRKRPDGTIPGCCGLKCKGLCTYPYHSTALQNMTSELFDTYTKLGMHLTTAMLRRNGDILQLVKEGKESEGIVTTKRFVSRSARTRSYGSSDSS